MERGWKPLPVILKVVFVLLLITIVTAFARMPDVLKNGTSLFTFKILGLGGLVIMLLLQVFLPLLLMAMMLKRYRFTWLVALFIFLFSICNSMLSLMSPELYIHNITSSENMNSGKQSFQTAAIVNLVLNFVLLLIFILKIKYFTGTTNSKINESPKL